MTTKDLSQLYYLKKEIKHDEETLDELRTKYENPNSPNLSGMPAGGTGESKIELLLESIVDTENIINAKMQECIAQRNIIERFIASIPDSLTRQIFEYRFVNGLPWSQVAANIGGGNTENGVKQLCSRYIRSHQSD